MLDRILKYRWYFCTLILCFIMHMLDLFRQYDIRMIADEICSLSGASHLAGLDWSGVIEVSKYYGVGYYFWYAFLFKLIENPIYLYLSIRLINIFVVSIVALIFFHISKKYLGFESNLEAFLLAIIVSFVGIDKGHRIYNEVGILFFSSVICLCIFKLNTLKKKEKNIFSIILALLLCWQLTIHTRTSLFLGVVVVVIVLSKLFFDKSIVNFKIFFPSMVLLYFAAQKFKDVVIKILWNGSDSAFVGFNESIPVGDITWLFSKEGFEVCKDIIISNITVCNQQSFGLFILSVCILIYFIFKYISAGKSIFIADQRESDINAYLLLMIGVIAVVGTIGGLVYLNGGGILLAQSGDMDLALKFRAYYFYRYYAPYLAISIIPSVKFVTSISQKVLANSLILHIGLTGIFLRYIFGDISNTTYISDILFINPYANIRKSFILFSIIILFFLVLLIIFKSKKLFLILVMVSLMYKITSGLVFPTYTFSASDGGYQFVQSLDTEVFSIYAKDNYYTYQFMLARYKINVGEPEYLGEGSILLTTYQAESDLNNEKYKFYIILDDNEMVYFNDFEIYEKSLENNYNVENCESVNENGY